MPRIVTVTSGKGGVGKTNLSANLSLHLAALGYRACIFDADLGLANINILLGLYPEHTIEDVILNKKSLSDVIIKNYQGIDVIPGSSGVEKIANIEADQLEHLIKSFSILDDYDFLFFDTSAGVSKHVIPFCLSSSEIILIITPEPTSLTDAYALLKILCLNGLETSVKIVVNQCKNTAIAKQTYSKFKEVVKKYLSTDVQPLGVIIEDPKISDAVRMQQPFISLFPETIASKCIRVIAKNFLEHKTDDSEVYNIESFWRRCIGLFKGPLNLNGRQEDKKDTQPEAHEHALPAEPVRQAQSAEMVKPAEQEEPVRAEEPAIPVKEEKEIDDSAEPETVYRMDKSFYSLIDKLVDSVSSISEEVKHLRGAIEGNGNINVSNRASDNAKPATEQTKPVILDFDKFIQQRNRE